LPRILFVSIAFPPKSDAEGLQVAKYFHYLQTHKDLEIDVVTSAVPTLYMPFDADLIPYSIGVRNLISVKLSENRYINYFLNRFGLDQYVFPDNKRSFHTQSDWVIKNIRETPALIYSRADPKSSSLLAYKLKKYFDVPWIMHLSDLWADCPLTRRSKLISKKHHLWERRCVDSADLVTVTSVPTLDFYKNKYPEHASKFRLCPNVYEPTDEKVGSDQDKYLREGKFRLVFTGAMAGDRSPEFILEPLSRWFKDDPTIEDRLEFIIAGEADARNREVLHRYDLPFVRWLGKVPYNDALQLQRSAHYLVLIDNPISDPKLSVFFPSKLLDYMLAQKRILAITTKGSATDLVMSDIKGDVCRHSDYTSLQYALYTALHAFEHNETDYLTADRPPEKYNAKFNADRLYHDIMSVLNG
jgi:hypothetical protein